MAPPGDKQGNVRVERSILIAKGLACRLKGAFEAGKEAYAMAGITSDDIDFAEVHDCFAIAELLAYEDLGFCPRGKSGPYIESGATLRDGARPVNNSGGLIAKGHPIAVSYTHLTLPTKRIV